MIKATLLNLYKYFLNFFSNLKTNLKLLDIIDIGVISLFIYLILVWLKKAKARFIFLGMIILGSIYIFARLFNLYLTTLIFQAFFAVFLITIIVIFQEELRHFFERIAIWGIPRRSFYKFPIREEIDILCNAIVNLLRKKIGALVVIKGNDPLERHISGGIGLDGLLSEFILESIFNPLSPTHDGAVIIEKNRIVKFSGHLPLSTNVKETAPLGTRHAAGLGVSERTDALCIIVSEERGIISVAEGGKLKQINDISELKLILENFYKEKYPSKKKFSFREFVMGHLLEKIIAVILAIGFWTIFGRRVEIVRRDFIIPIEYRNLASEKIIGEPKPKNISITLSGTERDFYLFKQEELKLSLDMSKTKDGENVFLITKDFIKTPPGLSVVNIEPKEIKLIIYRIISLEVPIELNIVGKPPFGVNIKEIKVSPEKISILVPSIMPKEKIKIITEPINLKFIRETTVFTPQIILPEEARFQNDKPPEVKVEVVVE